jgi:futalosine hydrolase
MKILVVAATSLELDFISDIQTSEKNQVIKKVLGVGQVPTTYHLLNHIESLTPDLIVQIGIAGSFVNDCTLGEVFAIGEEHMADMGVVEKGTFQSIFDLKLMDENQIPFTNRKLINPHHHLFQKTNLKKVSAITVNEVSTSPERISYYQHHFNPVLESMEGAAFHYCCIMKNIPFIQIRGVSNYVGERNKSKWRIEASLEAVAKSTQEFISNI